MKRLTYPSREAMVHAARMNDSAAGAVAATLAEAAIAKAESEESDG